MAASGGLKKVWKSHSRGQESPSQVQSIPHQKKRGKVRPSDAKRGQERLKKNQDYKFPGIPPQIRIEVWNLGVEVWCLEFLWCLELGALIFACQGSDKELARGNERSCRKKSFSSLARRAAWAGRWSRSLRGWATLFLAAAGQRRKSISSAAVSDGRTLFRL